MLERGEGDRVCISHDASATLFDRELFLEGIMAALLKELESQALQLSPQERGELIRRLIISLEGTPEDSPEAIAQAWYEKIARPQAYRSGCLKGLLTCP